MWVSLREKERDRERRDGFFLSVLFNKWLHKRCNFRVVGEKMDINESEKEKKIKMKKKVNKGMEDIVIEHAGVLQNKKKRDRKKIILCQDMMRCQIH